MHREVSTDKSGFIEIEPKLTAGPPMYFLYYTESRFLAPHYQSIRPITINESNSTVSNLNTSTEPPRFQRTTDSWSEDTTVIAFQKFRLFGNNK